MRPPKELVLARGEAVLRYLNARNQNERSAAKAELARYDTDLARFETKVSNRLSYHPLSGANPQDILR